MRNIEEFAEQLRISVDSRIQMIEYNMGKVILPYIPTNDLSSKSDFQNERRVIPTFASEKLYNDRLFSIIEEYSAKVCKLIYIRNRISPSNAVKTSKILESEEYLEWNKKQLRSFFGETAEKNGRSNF